LCLVTPYRFYCIAESRDVMVQALTKLTAKGAWSPMQRVAQGKVTPAGGFVVRRTAMGWIEHRYEDQITIYVITTPEFFQYLVNTDYPIFTNPLEVKAPHAVPSKKAPLEVLMRHGCYKNFYYAPLKIDVAHIEPIGAQLPATEAIVAFYRKNHRCACFISGVPNAGKSVTGYLVAKALGAKYCHSFNPLDPGDRLSTLITDANPCQDNPLVIVLEEADRMVQAIQTGKGRFNRDVPTMVHDKSTWCSFLDDFVFYNHTVLILTSNSTKEQLSGADGASCLREGRMHLFFHMPNPLP
jgi:hypothetical protein